MKYTRNTAISPVLYLQLHNYTFFFFISYNIIIVLYSPRQKHPNISDNDNFHAGFPGEDFIWFPWLSIIALRSRRHRKRDIFDRTHLFCCFGGSLVSANIHATHARTHSRVESRHRRYALTRHRRRRQPPRRRSAVLAGSSSCPSGEHMLPRSPCVRLTKLRRYTLL